MKTSVLGLFMLLGLAGCSHLLTDPPPKATTTKPNMAWYWAGQPAPQPSDLQFKQDKYACAQDYRMTQPAIPVWRDVVTELRLMMLHLDTCMQSKGWESRPVAPVRAIPPSPAPAWKSAPEVATPTPSAGPWTAYAIPASKVLNAVPGRAYDWYWTGALNQEPSHRQFQDYAAACSRDYIKSQPVNFDLTPHLRTCMKDRGWDSNAVPTTKNFETMTPSEQAAYQEAKTKVDTFAATHPDFDELADDILAFIQKGASLEDAYDQAVKLRDSTRFVK